jgi:hypothetical protein
MEDKKQPGNSSLMQYAGYCCAHWLQRLILGVLLGMWVDKQINIGFPDC